MTVNKIIERKKKKENFFTMFNLPLPTNDEIKNVAMHDEQILSKVLTIARVCPSSTAVAELNDGQNNHKNKVPIIANKSEL